MKIKGLGKYSGREKGTEEKYHTDKQAMEPYSVIKCGLQMASLPWLPITD